MNILSIDAWGNEDDGWDWNAWYKVGTISVEEFEDIEHYVTWFVDNGYLNPPKNLYYCDDDGYNIVIYVAATREPIYAIEYGY